MNCPKTMMHSCSTTNSGCSGVRKKSWMERPSFPTRARAGKDSNTLVTTFRRKFRAGQEHGPALQPAWVGEPSPGPSPGCALRGCSVPERCNISLNRATRSTTTVRRVPLALCDCQIQTTRSLAISCSSIDPKHPTVNSYPSGRNVIQESIYHSTQRIRPLKTKEHSR